jgi:hypothetical protein
MGTQKGRKETTDKRRSGHKFMRHVYLKYLNNSKLSKFIVYDCYTEFFWKYSIFSDTEVTSAVFYKYI